MTLRVFKVVGVNRTHGASRREDDNNTVANQDSHKESAFMVPRHEPEKVTDNKDALVASMLRKVRPSVAFEESSLKEGTEVSGDQTRKNVERGLTGKFSQAGSPTDAGNKRSLFHVDRLPLATAHVEELDDEHSKDDSKEPTLVHVNSPKAADEEQKLLDIDEGLEIGDEPTPADIDRYKAGVTDAASKAAIGRLRPKMSSSHDSASRISGEMRISYPEIVIVTENAREEALQHQKLLQQQQEGKAMQVPSMASHRIRPHFQKKLRKMRRLMWQKRGR